MKSCTQIWKTRNLTVKGKTLIVKNLFVSQMGYEIERRDIPDRFKNEINLMENYMGRQNKSNRSKCLLFGQKGVWNGYDKY
jgi:hypothetical protein